MLRGLTAVIFIITALHYQSYLGRALPEGVYDAKQYFNSESRNYSGYGDIDISVIDDNIKVNLNEYVKLDDNCKVETSMILYGKIDQNKKKAKININKTFFKVKDDECLKAAKISRRMDYSQYIEALSRRKWQVSPVSMSNKSGLYCFNITSQGVMCFNKKV